MNVWVVYADSGAYSDWFRVADAVFSTQEKAERYAAEGNAKCKCDRKRAHWDLSCPHTSYEVADMLVVDGFAPAHSSKEEG